MRVERSRFRSFTKNPLHLTLVSFPRIALRVSRVSLSPTRYSPPISPILAVDSSSVVLPPASSTPTDVPMTDVCPISSLSDSSSYSSLLSLLDEEDDSVLLTVEVERLRWFSLSFALPLLPAFASLFQRSHNCIASLPLLLRVSSPGTESLPLEVCCCCSIRVVVSDWQTGRLVPFRVDPALSSSVSCCCFVQRKLKRITIRVRFCVLLKITHGSCCHPPIFASSESDGLEQRFVDLYRQRQCVQLDFGIGGSVLVSTRIRINAKRRILETEMHSFSGSMRFVSLMSCVNFLHQREEFLNWKEIHSSSDCLHVMRLLSTTTTFLRSISAPSTRNSTVLERTVSIIDSIHSDFVASCVSTRELHELKGFLGPHGRKKQVDSNVAYLCCRRGMVRRIAGVLHHAIDSNQIEMARYSSECLSLIMRASSRSDRQFTSSLFFQNMMNQCLDSLVRRCRKMNARRAALRAGRRNTGKQIRVFNGWISICRHTLNALSQVKQRVRIMKAYWDLCSLLMSALPQLHQSSSLPHALLELVEIVRRQLADVADVATLRRFLHHILNPILNAETSPSISVLQKTAIEVYGNMNTGFSATIENDLAVHILQKISSCRQSHSRLPLAILLLYAVFKRSKKRKAWNLAIFHTFLSEMACILSIASNVRFRMFHRLATKLTTSCYTSLVTFDSAICEPTAASLRNDCSVLLDFWILTLKKRSNSSFLKDYVIYILSVLMAERSFPLRQILVDESLFEMILPDIETDTEEAISLLPPCHAFFDRLYSIIPLFPQYETFLNPEHADILHFYKTSTLSLSIYAQWTFRLSSFIDKNENALHELFQYRVLNNRFPERTYHQWLELVSERCRQFLEYSILLLKWADENFAGTMCNTLIKEWRMKFNRSTHCGQ